MAKSELTTVTIILTIAILFGIILLPGLSEIIPLIVSFPLTILLGMGAMYIVKKLNNDPKELP